MSSITLRSALSALAALALLAFCVNAQENAISLPAPDDMSMNPMTTKLVMAINIPNNVTGADGNQIGIRLKLVPAGLHEFVGLPHDWFFESRKLVRSKGRAHIDDDLLIPDTPIPGIGAFGPIEFEIAQGNDTIFIADVVVVAKLLYPDNSTSWAIVASSIPGLTWDGQWMGALSAATAYCANQARWLLTPARANTSECLRAVYMIGRTHPTVSGAESTQCRNFRYMFNYTVANGTVVTVDAAALKVENNTAFPDSNSCKPTTGSMFVVQELPNWSDPDTCVTASRVTAQWLAATAPVGVDSYTPDLFFTFGISANSYPERQLLLSGDDNFSSRMAWSGIQVVQTGPLTNANWRMDTGLQMYNVTF